MYCDHNFCPDCWNSYFICTGCPGGKYSTLPKNDDEVADVCVSCPPGSYSSDTVATSCYDDQELFQADCAAEFFDSSDQTNALRAPITECSLCPVGKYQDVSGSVTCIDCPAARTTDTDGSTTCTTPNADDIAAMMEASPEDAAAQTRGCDAIRTAATDLHGITCGGNWGADGTSNCDAFREAGLLATIVAATARFPNDGALLASCNAALTALTTDPCAKVDCGEGGACVLGECQCEAGFCGTQCEFNGMGVAGPGSDVGACECEGGYSGDHCEELTDPCFDQHCNSESGQGFCQVSTGSCVCVPGFTGEHCECEGECDIDGSATGDAVDGSWSESPAAAALGLASFDAAETAAVATIGALALVAMGAVIRRSHHRRFQQHVRIPDDPSTTQSADGATDVDEHAERVLLTAAV